MAELVVNGSVLGSKLQTLLLAPEIEPGSDGSYELCKEIFLYHPLGAKIAESPISIAQSQQREISVPDSPEEAVVEAFNRMWKNMGIDRHIFNVMRTARIYGISSLIYGAEGVPTDKPIDPMELHKLEIYFNVFDPLNTAGSMVLNQDPNSPSFQKVDQISVSGAAYHRSRACVVLNEAPIYIAYTSSGFGYVGRSVYQRALFPLKSFIQSMITDDMVTRKAGVLVAKMKQAGSIVDNMMARVAGIKRSLLKDATTNQVLGIGIDEDIMSINLQNLEAPLKEARSNILANIATAVPMPSKLLNSETFAEGFGEGTEDAKHVASYIDRLRVEMDPIYTFMDRIVQHRAWSPDFYETIQAKYPEYKDVDYATAFYKWQNSFAPAWPSLLTEPDSEKINVDKTKMESIISMVEVLQPEMDPANKARLLQWAADNFNENKLLFTNPLVLDWEAFEENAVEQAELAKQQAAAPPGGEGGESAEEDGQDGAKPPAPKGLSKAA